MKLTIAYSPCPNDTFAFNALVNSLIDVGDFEFDVQLMDIQALNDASQEGSIDICKMSYHNYFFCAKDYVMLRCGSALGFNNGPVLVKNKGVDLFENNSLKQSLIIALPGERTTAAFLLKSLFKGDVTYRYMLFSEIENAVKKGDVDAGVLIHEGRFVFQERGLELVADLGELWCDKTGLAVPLGGIAVKRELISSGIAHKIQHLLLQSINFAYDFPESTSEYVMENAHELSEDIQRRHIETFVNDYTKDIGAVGEKSVEEMYNEFLMQNPKLLREDRLFL